MTNDARLHLMVGCEEWTQCAKSQEKDENWEHWQVWEDVMWEIGAAQCSKVMTKVSHFSDTSHKASSKGKRGLGCFVTKSGISAVVLKSYIP